jgi:hypothetical protein
VPEHVMNPFARSIWARLVSEYPEWREQTEVLDNGDFECWVSAPPGSKALHLIVFTSQGKDLWVRYALPQMCYSLDDEDEMLSIIGQLLRDEALFVVTKNSGEWTGTTLICPEEEPEVDAGEIAKVVSWSGKLDRLVKG